MKKILLLFCLFPLLSSAQDIYGEYKFAEVLLSSRSRSQPSLRYSPSPYAPLDSSYVYEDTSGDDLLIAKYTYEYDGYHIIKREGKGYSGDIELYQMKTTYAYEPNGYLWTEQIDSIFEQNRYTPKNKYTRVYNEENYMIDYREYESNYDNPWGRAIQIYSAVEFNEKNMPVVYIDSVIPSPLSAKPYTIRKWEITYHYTSVESMTCYVESNKEWTPEVKYVISYNADFPETTMEIFTMENGEWSVKTGEVINYIDDRANRGWYQKRNEKGELIQSFRFKHFYDETATHNDKLANNRKSPEIQLDNSSRTLTVSLNEVQKGSIAIVNASGRIVLNQTLDHADSRISLANLQPGYYVVCIRIPESYSKAIILW